MRLCTPEFIFWKDSDYQKTILEQVGNHFGEVEQTMMWVNESLTEFIMYLIRNTYNSPFQKIKTIMPFRKKKLKQLWKLIM